MTRTADPLANLVGFDSEGRIAADLPCRGCGYLLRMQPRDGDCPECGLAVRETLEASNLRLLPLDWLRKVQAGAVCMVVAVPMMLLFGLGILAFLLGVLTLLVEAPVDQLKMRGLRRWITGSLLGVFLLFVGLFVLMESVSGIGDNEWVGIAYLELLMLCIGMTLMGVTRVGRLVAATADWAKMRVWASVMAWLLLFWPAMAVPVLWLMVMLFDGAWSGQSTPRWLDTLYSVAAMCYGLGWLVLAILHMVFWTVLAARMQRMRREAKQIYLDRQAALLSNVVK